MFEVPEEQNSGYLFLFNKLPQTSGLNVHLSSSLVILWFGWAQLGSSSVESPWWKLNRNQDCGPLKTCLGGVSKVDTYMASSPCRLGAGSSADAVTWTTGSRLSLLGFPHVAAAFPEGAAQEEVFQKSRSVSLSIQAAITKFHKLVSLKSTEISFSQLAGRPRSRCRQIWCLERIHLLDGPLFTATSHSVWVS